MAILDEVMASRDPQVRKSKEKLKEAATRSYPHERAAADMYEPTKKNEPTRGVLYRSAGWIAMDAQMYKEAKECAEKGLEGMLHAEIREELQELLDAANDKL